MFCVFGQFGYAQFDGAIDRPAEICAQNGFVPSLWYKTFLKKTKALQAETDAGANFGNCKAVFYSNKNKTFYLFCIISSIKWGSIKQKKDAKHKELIESVHSFVKNLQHINIKFS